LSEKNITGGYIGKAGEHAVCSALLLRGFNASIMSVDEGMDIVATKDDQLYELQVKTAKTYPKKTGQKTLKFAYDIREATMGKNLDRLIFYTFVCILDETYYFFTVPLSVIHNYIELGLIRKDAKRKKFKVFINKKEDMFYMGRAEESAKLGIYLNNWNLVKTLQNKDISQKITIAA
jgi:hypothetical protein